MTTEERHGGSGRIGIFGGTFNPVHIAHLIVAEEIRERLGLDEILFIPAGDPPHKREEMPGGEHRLAMLRLSTATNPFFTPLDIEVTRPGKSYTIETLRTLRGGADDDAEFFFLIGTDAFEEITTWHMAERLVDYAHFVVFPRPGHPLADIGPYMPPSWRALPSRPDGRGIERVGIEGKKEIFMVHLEGWPLSASIIRQRAGNNISIRHLVSDDVADYITRHGLYSNQKKGG